MKSILLLCFICTGTIATAQITEKKTTATPQKQVLKSRVTQSQASGTVTLTQSGSNAAKAAPAPPLQISDPLVRSFKYGTAGDADYYSNGRPMGLPRGTYGFGNGQFYLRSTDAAFGSGAVGTGSSAGPVGTAGMALGVNGKSPYAGPAMWGSARGLNMSDSLLKRGTGTKKN